MNSLPQPRRTEQTDGEKLEDSIVSAMETGNHSRAREIAKAHEESFADDVFRIRHMVMRDYGTRI